MERDGESFQRNEKDSAFLPACPPPFLSHSLSPSGGVSTIVQSYIQYTGQVRVGGEGGSDKNQNEAALPG